MNATTTFIPKRLVSRLPVFRTQIFLSEVRANLQPYLFYWEEWLVSENCNLNVAEIEAINGFIQVDFSFRFAHLFSSQYKVSFLQRIIFKLRTGLQVFKEFIILQFLCEIIRLHKEYGNDSFLDSPLSLLAIPQPLKAAFRDFNVFCVRQLFYSNTEQQFYTSLFQERMLNFLVLLKKEQYHLHTNLNAYGKMKINN